MGSRAPNSRRRGAAIFLLPAAMAGLGCNAVFGLEELRLGGDAAPGGMRDAGDGSSSDPADVTILGDGAETAPDGGGDGPDGSLPNDRDALKPDVSMPDVSMPDVSMDTTDGRPD